MLKSNYEIEVLVNGKPLKEFIHDSKVYVEGRKGTTFSLRLRNSSGQRKLFTPSIDGLSVMNGSEASFSSSGYIVKPYSAVTIDGWRMSDVEVAQFYFSAPNDSYRKRMEKGNNLGVIGCVVFSEKEKRPMFINMPCHYYRKATYCWVCRKYHCPCNVCFSETTTSTYPTTYPTEWINIAVYSTQANAGDVMATLNASAGNHQTQVNAFSMRSVSQDLGTGWGDKKRSEVVSVEFDREGSPSEVFEIYYNAREQLEAMGINLNREPLYVTPQAFPGQYCMPPESN